MTPTAILLMVLIAGFVWGGFTFVAAKAIRKEREKLRSHGQDRPDLR